MAKLPIISADQRLSEVRGIKGCILGKAGIGKTSLLWTLDPASTLFIDLEAGDLAVAGWGGDTIRVKHWNDCRDLAVFLGGGNLAIRDGQPYSNAHYKAAVAKFGEPGALDKYDTIFIDSITVAGRLCFQWCKNQPAAFSDKTGKEDLRTTYGLHGQEMITWIIHLQHIRKKNIWFVGILDEKLDDLNRKIFSIQIDGSKTANELPAIVDQLITIVEIKTKDGSSTRAFINHTINPYGYPAKDRSGSLELMEEPHLGKLMEKIKSKTNNKIQSNQKQNQGESK